MNLVLWCLKSDFQFLDVIVIVPGLHDRRCSLRVHTSISDWIKSLRERSTRKQYTNSFYKGDTNNMFFLPPSNSHKILILKKNSTNLTLTQIPNMRSRSGSVTPAYSTDRDLLRSHYPGASTLSSIEEVKTAISKLSIFDDTTFKRRVPLETDADWSNFVSSCCDECDPGSYNLDLLLKKCYTAAYSMPPSPTSQIRTQDSKEEAAASPVTLAI